MFLRSVSLRQFRNHDRFDVSFGPGLNLIAGPNGIGKSNLLEAVALLARGESHRGADAKQLFAFDKEEFCVTGDFDGEEGLAVDVRQRRGRPRQTRFNNALLKRRSEGAGRIPVVTFCPEDLSLVKGDPSTRRRALNDILQQTDPSYADALSRYQGVLEERNACLKNIGEGRGSRAHLDPWDLALLKEGASLTVTRDAFVRTFTAAVDARHRELTEGRESAALIYKPSFLRPLGSDSPATAAVSDIAAANRRRLVDLRDGEIALGSTLIGPHRDDVEVVLNDRPAKGFASQGQQRTLTLAWKLAERNHLEIRLGRRAFCLLDDLLSELDPARRSAAALRLMEGGQMFVTVTALSDWGETLPSDAHVVHVGATGVEAA